MMSRQREAFRASIGDWPPRLDELADYIGAQLQGDPALRIRNLASLQSASGDTIAFFDGVRGGRDLQDCKAGALVLAEEHAERFAGSRLISPRPRQDFVRLTALYDTTPAQAVGIDAQASVDPSATVDLSASIAAGVVIAAGAVIGEGVVLGPGCFIGAATTVGAYSRLHANVTLYHGVELGENAVLHAGTVIGSDGFGFAPSAEGYLKFHHLGGVKIGRDFECGALTAIDRGALEDTVLGDGVKMDNHVHVGHNVRIGDHTAMAGLVGIGGGVRIGAHCAIGGGTIIVSHMEIADRVFIESDTLVARSVRTPGVRISGNWPAEDAKLWRRRQMNWRK